MVVYFSGTGNSRFVAERIAAITGDTVFDAFGSIKSGTVKYFREQGNYVFVSPVYAGAPPKIFMEFIKRSVFPEGTRAYFVMTCAGSMVASAEYCRKLAVRMKFEYMGTAEIVMPQNYIVFYGIKSDEENERTVRDALPEIGSVAKRIRAGKPLAGTSGGKALYGLTDPVLGLYYRFFIKSDSFLATDRCMGCGKCASLCPMGNIDISEGKPVWGKNCTHCMACINLCPVDAVEYGRKTEGKPRYKGPAHKP